MIGTILHQGVRALRRRVGATVLSLAILALGLGAPTAMFAVVDALLLRPLPYPDAGRLVVVYETAPGEGERAAAPANFLDWRRDARSFDDMAAWFVAQRTLAGGGDAERIRAASVSASFLPMLGAKLVIGRLFATGDGDARLVLLGHATWHRQFGGDSAIVGRMIRLDDIPWTVVGVLDPAFAPPEQADVWTLAAEDVPELAQLPGPLSAERDIHYISVIGRLAPRTTLSAARHEMDRLAAALAVGFPATNRDLGVNVVPLRDAIAGNTSRLALLLFGIMGFVLLIVCANIANLQLAAAAARASEFTVRTALGARRSVLVGQLLADTLLLSLVGGLLGLGVAQLLLNGLVTMSPIDLPSAARLTIDARVFGFVLLLSLLAGAGVGIAPALRIVGQLSLEGLSSGTRTIGARSRLRAGLVVVQLALSLALLAGAATLVESYRRVSSVDPGFRPEGLVTLEASLSRGAYGGASRAVGWYQRVLGDLRTIPGVQGVAAISQLPIGGGSMDRGVSIEGRPDPERPGDQTIEYSVASPDWNSVLGIPLRSGRAFSGGDDATGEPVALINESAARRYWPGLSPIDARVGFGNRDGGVTWRRIVGVVADVRHFGLDQAPRPEVYVPMAQESARSLAIIVRSSVNVAPDLLARVARGIDPSQPVGTPRAMTELIAQSLARPRFLALVLAGFAALAVGLAILGLYAVQSHLVQSRTREIGVRAALGARPMELVTMVARQSAALLAAGVALGLGMAVALGRALQGLVYEVSGTDPALLAAAATLLFCAGMGAAMIPARRAAHVDPSIALSAGEGVR